MSLTARMKWTIPTEDADPWYDALTALIGQQDASAYAAREDRNIVLMGGGDITWTLLTGILSWTEPLRVFSPVSGFQCIVAAGNVQLDQSGKLLHAPLVRYPTGGNKTITAAVASQVPDVNPNDQLLFAVRYGDKVYWRNGLVLSDGMTITDMSGAFSAGGDLSGTPSDQTVVGIQGRAVDPTAPTLGQVMKWLGASWGPGEDLQGIISTLVFRPAGTQTGNVYTSWSDLMTEFGSLAGPVWIQIEGESDIPSGTWDLEGRALLRSRQDGARPTLRLLSGAQLENPAALQHLAVRSESTSTGFIYLQSGGHCYVDDCSFVTESSDQALIRQVIGHKLYFHNSSMVEFGESTPVLQAVGANGVNVEIYLQGFSAIGDNCFGDAADIDVWIEGGWATCGTVHAEHTGSLTIYEPPGAVANTLVLAPGYLGSASNTYDNWADLYAVLSSISGPRVVQFDDHYTDGATILIPSGTYDLGMDTVLEARSGDYVTTRVKVQMQDGAVFENLGRLRGIVLESVSSSPVLAYSPVVTGRGNHLVLEGMARLVNSGTASDAFCDVPPNGLVVSLEGSSEIESVGMLPVFDCQLASGPLVIVAEDSAIVGAAVIATAPGAQVTIYSLTSGSRFSHNLTNVTYVDLAGKRERHLLVKGITSNATATPGTAGVAYLDQRELHGILSAFILATVAKVTYRVVMATTSGTAGYEAYMDLYDVNGVVSAGTPGIVPGSQMNTASSSPPPDGPTPNALVLSTYETDITSVFFGGGWTGPGVFEARLWIATAGGGNSAMCASAELIFSWQGKNAEVAAPIA
jgi:hypothetical protein